MIGRWLELERRADSSIRVASDNQPGVFGAHVQVEADGVSVGANFRHRAWPLIQGLVFGLHYEYQWCKDDACRGTVREVA